jgi:hypothetical protein
MASADFCTITACIAAGRAVRLDDVAASFFDTWRAARYGAWVLVSRWNPSGLCRHPVAPLAVQISPGKGRELSVHKRRIYRRRRTGGLSSPRDLLFPSLCDHWQLMDCNMVMISLPINK